MHEMDVFRLKNWIGLSSADRVSTRPSHASRGSGHVMGSSNHAKVPAMSRTLFVAIASLALALASGGASAAPKWPTRPIELKLAAAPGRLRLLDTQVGGQPRKMMFDTGGGITAISPALAREIGCEPTGNVTGLRFTGQRLDSPVCRGVELSVGGIVIRTDVAVMDLAALLGKNAPPVDGMVSLATFSGLAVTLELAGSRLWIESAGSLAARTRKMSELAFRPATGVDGGQLSPFLGVSTPRGTVWLEWDSGHSGTTFVSPGTASLLGVPDGAPSGEVELALAPSRRVHAPVVVRKDLVIDGVLSAAFVARGIWTLDLAANRCWAGPIAELLHLPMTAGAPPRSSDLAGVYELALMIQGKSAPHVLGVRREAGAWIAELRALGDDETVRLENVQITGNELTATLPLRPPAPLQLTIDGTSGKGSWGDPKARGGTVTATKRR
jgi:hypothetical protein